MTTKLKKENLTEKQKKIIGIMVFLCFLAFCGLVTWFIGRPMIRFVSEPEKFRAWVDEGGFFGKLAFIFMTAFQVVIAFVPGEPLEIGGGYAFGAVEGTVLAVIGITLGSLAVFFLVRRFGVKLVEIFFSREKINELKFLKNTRQRNILIFIVFFLPGTPKDLLTYFAGLTDIKFTHFLLLASVARLPSVITSTLGGNALGAEEYRSAIIVFAVTVAISGAGLLIYRLIRKKRNKN